MVPSTFMRKAVNRAYREVKYLQWELVNRVRQEPVTLSTRQGVLTLQANRRDVISRELFTWRHYEWEFYERTMAFLREAGYCSPRGQGTILDIGANLGVISIGALYTGEMQRAIAIEPEPSNFALLKHNVDQNGLTDRFICLPYAISDQNRELNLELNPNNTGDHRLRPTLPARDAPELERESERATITIEARSLDQLAQSWPTEFTSDLALVWIDIQGWEGNAFVGGKSLLSSGVPVVSEIWPYGILRSGMSLERYCESASDLWQLYWICQDDKFVRYSIDTLRDFVAEIGVTGDFTNIVFTQ